MSYTRRTLLQHSAALAALGVLPNPVMAMLQRRPEFAPLIEDPEVKPLTAVSLDAARAAGAAYAEARLTHTYVRRISNAPAEEESMTFGVRVLVDGYWGFASSPVWTSDEAARLARAAVRNAKANTLGKTRAVELAPVAPIANGHWTTPIKDDPFAISKDEIQDYLGSLRYFISKIPGANPQRISVEFVKQDRAFASTHDQYYTQRLYRTSGNVTFIVEHNSMSTGVSLESILPASAGFEHLRDRPLREEIMKRYEEAKEDLLLPLKPVDVGRYNMVMDASSIATLLSMTIGRATELDRALGYEANAGGTSYITDPVEMAGSFKIGGPALTVTANRSEPQGAATVKWDDEGVEPQPFTLVKNGILTDMQTNREGAGWFKTVYEKQQRPMVSHGCAYTPDAIHTPLTHCANLQIQPGDDNGTFESMIAGESRGIALKRASIDMDFQQITGFGSGAAFEIKNGKRVASLPGLGVIFRTPELWNNILACGGSSSQVRFGLQTIKGQPRQSSYHSVTSVPVAFKELTVIDATRKA